MPHPKIISLEKVDLIFFSGSHCRTFQMFPHFRCTLHGTMTFFKKKTDLGIAYTFHLITFKHAFCFTDYSIMVEVYSINNNAATTYHRSCLKLGADNTWLHSPVIGARHELFSHLGVPAAIVKHSRVTLKKSTAWKLTNTKQALNSCCLASSGFEEQPIPPVNNAVYCGSSRQIDIQGCFLPNCFKIHVKPLQPL